MIKRYNCLVPISKVINIINVLYCKLVLGQKRTRCYWTVLFCQDCRICTDCGVLVCDISYQIDKEMYLNVMLAVRYTNI